MGEDLEVLRAYVDYLVKEGFESVHQIIENATDYAFEKFECDDLGAAIRRMTAESLAAHRAEQAGWEGTTDCDRLDEAFAALNRRGIVARQDFSCCNTCGFTEIWDEVEEEQKRGRVEGYVFYHLQGTEQAIKSGQLLMAYGSVEDDTDVFRRVGETIVAELRRVGLDASWNGTDRDPVLVKNITWRRRR